MFVVSAPLVYLKVPGVGGGYVSSTFYAGSPVPGNVDAASLQHHIDNGQVEEIAAPKIEPAFPEGEPDESWTVPQLKAYAGYRGVDLADSKSKADILKQF